MDFLVVGQGRTFYDYPSHSHDYWELLLNLEGEGTARIGGIDYEFNPGTIFCIRPGVMHEKRAEKGFSDGSILLSDFCFASKEEDVFVFQDDERHSFYQLYQIAFGYPLNPATDTYAERFLRSIIDAMQNLLCHWADTTLRNSEVIRIQKLLADHVCDCHLDLDAIIAQTGYSPNHFRKLFHDACGCSPLQYYNQLKIQLAKQQILQHKSIMTIKEIAQNCGFEDPYYFSRLFKNITGSSPMQFFNDSQRKLTPPIPQK